MIASWDDSLSSWTVAKKWDENTIVTALKALSKRSEYTEIFRIIAKVAVSISDTPGEGTSFVVALGNVSEGLYPAMTDCPADGEWSENLLAKSLEGKTFAESLFRYATQDGGVFIDLKKRIYKARRQFLPTATRGKARKMQTFGFSYRTAQIEVNGSQKDLWKLWETEGGPYSWEDWYRVLHWGTKHLSALGMSYCLNGKKGAAKAISVVVSEDGPISVFFGAKGLSPAEKQ
jgi:hypothetical protein